MQGFYNVISTKKIQSENIRTFINSGQEKLGFSTLLSGLQFFLIQYIIDIIEKLGNERNFCRRFIHSIMSVFNSSK